MKQLVLVGLVGCAHATPLAPAKSPASLVFYIGHWSCDGTSYDDNGAVERKWPALEIRVAAEYDNWLRVDVLDHGKQITSELKGVDDKGVFHHVWTASDGSYGSLTAPGWAGNQLVFDEDHAGAEKTRMTFTKLDDTHYTHKAEVDGGSGYKLGFEKTCHKVS